MHFLFLESGVGPFIVTLVPPGWIRGTPAENSVIPLRRHSQRRRAFLTCRAVAGVPVLEWQGSENAGNSAGFQRVLDRLQVIEFNDYRFIAEIAGEAQGAAPFFSHRIVY
ncbi:MAG: hypothetical protein OEW92_04225, partial [Gammaproteobacteria bacterium]|nr:hypothetical protein [Gammaproteobacteria bacterium]